MTLNNKLENWILTDKTKGKFRPFSHLASHPQEVTTWIPVKLDQLGGTVAMDRCSVELLNEMDITFNIGKRCSKTYIKSIDYHSPTKPQNEVEG